MNDEQLKKIIEDTYDDAKEDTLRSMLGDFYNRKMTSIIILVWIDFLIILALAIFSGIKFFKTDQTGSQIMYAAIFVCCTQFFVLIKVFGGQMIARNSIKREIKRLELRIAELSERIKSK
ncbi:MAG: DUF6768 family protein [Sedimentisphaerales bacterium]